MKKKRNKLFALLVMMLLIASLLPTNVFAASKPIPGKVPLTKISAPAYNKITVNWKKTSNTTHYAIYYKKYGASKWIKLTTASASKSSYTHTSSKKYPIVVGQKYTYMVRAYNSKSKKYGSYNTKGLTVKTIPDTVKLAKASLNSSKNAVTVTWNKAAGASHYAVYRKTGSSSWKRLVAMPANTISYIDKSPVKGQKNIYTVRSYNNKTKVYGKYNSKGVSVTVPKTIPVHRHTWQYHDAKGHNESVLVSAAWDEAVYENHVLCNQCGADFGTDANAAGEHTMWSDTCENYSTESVLVPSKTIHHEAVYETTWVQDSPAYSDCSTCGARQ